MSFEPGEDPFGLRADPERYVPRPETERALDEIERGVLLSESPVVLFGPPGIGKTLLLRVLAQRLATSFRTVHLPYPSLAAPDLCRWALMELGDTAAADPEAALVAEARRPHSRDLGVLLLMDDAEALPLETMRRLSELMRRCHGALRLVMASTESERTLILLDRAQTDVVIVELLEPMSPDETAACIEGLLAGSSEAVRRRFDATSIRKLHEACEGIPGRLQAVASAHLRSAPRASKPDPEATPRGAEAEGARSVLGQPDAGRSGARRRKAGPRLRIEESRPGALRRRLLLAAGLAAVLAGALAIGLTRPLGEALHADPAGARASAPATLERRRPERIDVAAAPPVAARAPAAAAQPAASAAPVPAQAAAAPPAPAPAPVEPKPAVAPEAKPARAPSVAAAPPQPAPEPAPRPRAAAPPLRLLSIDVEAPVGASIEIDGRSLGEAPLESIRVAAGRRRIVARLADGSVMQRTVLIDADGQRVVFY